MKKPTDSMGFSKRLCSARKQKNWSQSDLARYSGLTRAVISKWEKGASGHPSAPALQKAAKALDISVERLLTGKKDFSWNQSELSNYKLSSQNSSTVVKKVLIQLSDVEKLLEQHNESFTPKHKKLLSQRIEALAAFGSTKSTRSGKTKAA